MSGSRSVAGDLRRRVPAVERVLALDPVRALEPRWGREAVLRAVRRVLAEARGAAAAGDAPGLEAILGELAASVERSVAEEARPSLVRVINATGVVIHTNLGRAPLARGAAERAAAVGGGYSNLEYDLERGERGRREVHIDARLRERVGAEAALVVNNNAAAVLLAVNTLAEGREVLVSRGELVEIGGSFRIPEVLRKGGARLREVGTTNRTRAGDYAAAIGEETALLLRVHPSNFEIVGFTEAPALGELVELSRSAGLPLVEDLGGGLLTAHPALPGEPAARESLDAGADAVCFSGDKLLGGPQAGVLAGRRELIEAMRRNPLYRALRVDKLTLAALDAVLADHGSGQAGARVPVLRMLEAPADELRRRASALAEALSRRAPGLELELAAGVSAVGGGAAPGRELQTTLLRLRHPSRSSDELARELRRGEPAGVARVGEGALLIDPRCVDASEEEALLEALAALVKAGA
jgi:L-seryl-tRNA(Ser) seleniumtransferase